MYFVKRCFLYVLLQVIIFNHVVLWQFGFLFLYILPLLQLNVYKKTQVSHMLMAFLMATIIDYFSSTYGLHSASCVLMMRARTSVFAFLFRRFFKDENIVRPFPMGGYTSFFIYLLCVCFVYHAAFFTLESFTFQNFHWTLLNILLSTVFTSVSLLVFQKFFYAHR